MRFSDPVRMKSMRPLKVSIALCVVLWIALSSGLAVTAVADVTLPKVLGSNMLLQRDVPVGIWGRARPGETVEVSFAGQTRKTAADAKGQWRIELEPLPASAEGREMTIAGDNKLVLSNIVVGDVWVCSGQSNMEYPVRRPSQYKGPGAGTPDLATEALAAGKHKGLRLFKVQKVLSPDDVTTDGWQECEGEALAKFSAAGFFFAKDVFEATGVPIGLIDSSWGGTRIEVWTDQDVYGRYKELANVPTTRPLYVDGSPVGRNYSRMIKPLLPYRIKGFLWYQGESNCMLTETDRYTVKQKALIESWRQAWNAPDAPFYYVQLAPHLYSSRKQAIVLKPDTLPLFWEAQAAVQAVTNARMVVTTDLVDRMSDIHPWNKWVIGQRLAMLALARDYGKAGLSPYSPEFVSMKREGNALELSFDHAAGGLKTRDGKPPTEFLIAKADGEFVPARAEIVGGNRVRVWSEGMEAPARVRFNWREDAQSNLVSSAGLPVVPFRTDR